MENQVKSTSPSSTPKPNKLMEKTRENNNGEQGSCPKVLSETKADENPSSGTYIVRRGSDIMNSYPPESNRIYTCDYCKKEFSNFQALGGHQNGHKIEREREKKRKELEEKYPGFAPFSYYIDKPHLLLCGPSEDALSNDNNLGITLDPSKLIRNGAYHYGNRGNINTNLFTQVTPPTRFDTRNTNANDPSSRAPYSLSSHNNFGSLNSRNVPLFLPPRTINPFRNSFSKNNVLKEQDLISKVGMNNSVVQNNDVKDDEDDEPKRKRIKEWGLTLSL